LSSMGAYLDKGNEGISNKRLKRENTKGGESKSGVVKK